MTVRDVKDALLPLHGESIVIIPTHGFGFATLKTVAEAKSIIIKGKRVSFSSCVNACWHHAHTLSTGDNPQEKQLIIIFL